MYVQVILPDRTPLALPWFDYSVPSEIESAIRLGQLVLIPFRSRSHFGIVKSLAAKPSSDKPLKPIEKIVITEPLLAETQLKFLEEMSELYHTSLGFLLKMNLLPLQKRKLSSLEKAASRSPLEGGPRGMLANQLSFFGKPLVYTYTTNQERSQYIVEAIHELPLQANFQHLILVPEIIDAEQTRSFLPADLQEKTSVITSELSIKELFEQWRQIWSGEKTIVIGTRRALFLPWRNLANIIMDDEGNANYKSWDMAPRFHTRDAALILAKHQNAALHLLSHTPSVETFYFADKKIYQMVSSTPKKLDREYEIINLKDEKRGGNFTSLGDDLVEAIQKTNGDIFLFINRRGSLNYVACRDCQTVSRCPTCARPLSFHEDKKILVCHYCKYSEPMKPSCSNCGGIALALYGAGTQQVEREVKKIIDVSRFFIQRIDGDAALTKRITARRGGVTPPLPTGDNIQAKRLIIGTQLAWNHVDWYNISLMAFVDADISLFVPEYKTTEDLWQLIRDAAFRLPKQAELFIQTSHPEHVVFNSLYNPEQFYTQELTQRKTFGYPPYNYLVRFYFGHADKRRAEAESAHLYRELDWLMRSHAANLEQATKRAERLTKTSSSIKITPDLAMFPAYNKGRYWRVIIAKLSYRNYKKDLRLLLSKVPDSWKVDPNPNTLLSAN